MSSPFSNNLEAALPRLRSPIPNAVFGMALVLCTEAMLFAGLLSAYFVARSYVFTWPPSGQPRLPIAATTVNTFCLLASGAIIWRAVFTRSADIQRPTKIFYLAAIALGGIFVVAQGAEWLRLLRFGLTLTSGLYGSFFYLIVGMHALHAVAGLIALASVFPLFARNESARSGAVKAVGLYWLFVVGLWPVLYGLVYLL